MSKRLVRLSAAVAAAVLLSGPLGAQTVPPGEVRITLLGTGNPRPSLDRFGPSLLLEAGGEKLLVDAGRGATMRLFQIGSAPLLRDVNAVLLTHLHSDHVVGLPDLWLTPWIFGRAAPFVVYGPPGTAEMMTHLQRAFAFDVSMRRDIDERFSATGISVQAKDLDADVPIDLRGFRITPLVVDHGPVDPSYGYLIEAAGRRIAISGDTRYVEALAERARGADVIIHEVVSPEAQYRWTRVPDPEAVARIVDRHTPPDETGRLFALAQPRLAVYTHIVPSPATPEDLIPPTRQLWDGPLAVGYDLMTIAVGERIDVYPRPMADDR